MFKRSVARFLIVLQIYSCLFQGLHAVPNVMCLDDSESRYLHVRPTSNGLALALATKKLKGPSDPHIVDELYIPDYETFASGTTETISEEIAGLLPDCVTREKEGAYFTIQGIQVFLNNNGEMVLSGTQSEDSEPIFLSSERKIVLQNLNAKRLQLMAPAFFSFDSTHVDYLSLIGVGNKELEPTFTNVGYLTTKQMFLENLRSVNTGFIEARSFNSSGAFENSGHLSIHEARFTAGTFINYGYFNANSIFGSQKLEKFKNTASGIIELKEDGLLTLKGGIFINKGIIRGGEYYFAGNALVQEGNLSGIRLQIASNASFIAGTDQTIVLAQDFLSESTACWDLGGAISAAKFSHKGKVDLKGKLDVDTLKVAEITAKKGSDVFVRNNSELKELIIEEEAKVHLRNLLLNGFTVRNGGVFIVEGLKNRGDFTLINNGKSVIDASPPIAFKVHQIQQSELGKVKAELALQQNVLKIEELNKKLAFIKSEEYLQALELKELKKQSAQKCNALEFFVGQSNLPQIGISLQNAANAEISLKNGDYTLAGLEPSVFSQDPYWMRNIPGVSKVAVRNYLQRLKQDHKEGKNQAQENLAIRQGVAPKIDTVGMNSAQKARVATAIAADLPIIDISGMNTGQKLRVNNYNKEWFAYKSNICGTGMHPDLVGKNPAQINQIYINILALKNAILGLAAPSPVSGMHPDLVGKNPAQINQIYKNIFKSYRYLKTNPFWLEHIPGTEKAMVREYLGRLYDGLPVAHLDNARFSDSPGFFNSGKLLQNNSNIKVKLGQNGAKFNAGTWLSNTDTDLGEYKGNDLGKFEVEGRLSAKTELDALEALERFKEVKAAKLIMHAKEFDDSVPCATARTLPWVTELHLQGKFVSVNEIVTAGLKLFCKDFLVKGILSAGIDETQQETQQDGYGFLSIQAIDSKVTIEGKLFGQKGVGVKAKNILIEGRESKPGAALTDLGYPGAEQSLRVIYQKNGSGISSLDGSIIINFDDEFVNNFGTVCGKSFIFNGKTLRNVAGFISGTDSTLQSQIAAENIQNTREKLGDYMYWTCPWRLGGGTRSCPKTYCTASGKGRKDDGNWTPCGSQCTKYPKTCETSEEGVIDHAGSLTIIYRNLTNEVSRITSGNILTFDARAADQSMDPGAAGNRLVLEGDTLSRSSNPHQGMTVVRDRNGQDSLIRGKNAVRARFGNLDAQGGMHSRSIALAAANATFENLNLTRRQQARIERLAEYMLNKGSSMYRVLPDTGQVDTCLPVAHGVFPRAITAIGEVPEHIDLYATMRSFEYIYRERMSYIYNGIRCLGLSFAEFAEITAQELQEQEGSQVHRRLISDGRSTHPIDVVTNSSLTAQSLSRLTTPLVLLEFGRNLSLAEAEVRAAAHQQSINQDAQTIAARNQELLKKARESKARVDIALFMPEQEIIKGVRSEAAPLVAHISDALIARGAVEISGRGGDIKADSIVFESEAVRHGNSENFTETAARVLLANRGEGSVMNIRSNTDVVMRGIVRDSGGVGSSMSISAQGAIYELALALTSQSTTHTRHSKKKSSTTVTTRVSNVGVEQIGSGSVVMNSDQAVVQQGSVVSQDTTLTINAPVHVLEAVQDSVHVVTTESKKGKSGVFGKKASKQTQSQTNVAETRGSILRGYLKSTSDTFTSRATIYEAGADIKASRSASFTADAATSLTVRQTHYHGALYDKTRVEGEKRLNYTPNIFSNNVFVTAPEVLAQVKTMDDLKNLKCTDEHGKPIQPIIEMVRDTHVFDKPKVTKSLSMGAALITKLAIAIATYGTFGVESLAAHMASASYSTLCGEISTAFIENNARLDKTFKAVANDHTLKAVVRSAATAGVVHGLTSAFSDAVGEAAATDTATSTAGQSMQSGGEAATKATEAATSTAKTLTDYAREAFIQSTADTVVSAAMDGIPLDKLLQRGIITAAINTAAAYTAGGIGKLRGAKEVNYLAHKALHGALGATFGAAMATVSHNDPRLGALSGAFGAVTSEMIAEGFNPEQTDIESYQLANPEKSKAQVVDHFMESARKTASWSTFTSAAAAFGLGLDPSIAHTTASNAVNNNLLKTLPIFLLACTAMTPEYHNFFINMRAEGIEVALKKLGIGLVDTATVALAVETGIGALPYAFEVGEIVVKSLQEALAIVARNPGLSGEAKQLHTAMQANLPKVEGMVVESARFKLFGTDKVYIDPSGRTWQAPVSKYESVLANIPGKVVSKHDSLTSGVLQDTTTSTFSGGKYAVIELEKPLIVHRAWAAGQSRELGKFWSLEKPAGSLQTSIDTALRPEWGNFPETAFRVRPSEFTTIQIPAGTKIYAGEVGSQGGAWVGGNSQIFIAQEINPAWRIGGGKLQ